MREKKEGREWKKDILLLLFFRDFLRFKSTLQFEAYATTMHLSLTFPLSYEIMEKVHYDFLRNMFLIKYFFEFN